MDEEKINGVEEEVNILKENSRHYNKMEHEGLKLLTAELMENKILDDIGCDMLRDICKQVDNTMDVVMEMITDGGQYKEGNSRTWVDILVVSAFCYYAYWREDYEVSSLYQVRDCIEKCKDDNGCWCDCPPNILEALCETVECSRGCRTKVRKCMPAPNSPQQVLGDVIWYLEKFPIKK